MPKTRNAKATDEGGLARTIEAAFRWAHRRLPRNARRRMDTGDVVQESLVNVLRNMGELENVPPEELKSYLVTAIRNKIVDEVRRAKLGEVENDASPSFPDPRPSPHDEAVEREFQRKYWSALESIDEADQLLIVGRVDLQLSYEELALATGRPTPGAARHAARRAAEKLAKKMKRKTVGSILSPN